MISRSAAGFSAMEKPGVHFPQRVVLYVAVHPATPNNAVLAPKKA
jgi:hypothetical protein